MPFKSDGRIDWAAIRAAYEAGGISDRALAREHGIWLRAIQTKAESENWERPDMPKDHGGPVSRAQAIAAQPSSKITQPAEPSNQLMVKPQKPVTDVAVSHKDVITRSRSLVYRLLDELDGSVALSGAAYLDRSAAPATTPPRAPPMADTPLPLERTNPSAARPSPANATDPSSNAGARSNGPSPDLHGGV